MIALRKTVMTGGDAYESMKKELKQIISAYPAD